MKPDDTSTMTWSLVSETGMEPAPQRGTTVPLCFPTFAAKTADGTYWIGDELGTHKLVPFRLESRTIRLGADHRMVFDSLLLGIDDGFGCPLDHGSMAILRRTKWELLIVSPDGTTTDCLHLSSLSKRMPRYVSWTDQSTFLIVFCDRAGEVDIVEMDRQGRPLWFLPPRAAAIGVAGSVQRLPTNNILVADPFRHVVLEIDRGGNVVWQFGEAKQPASAASHLSSPGSARALSDGSTLIADTRNHRILLVARNGTTRQLQPHDDHFCDPMYATALRNGHYLICDTGNRRVVEMDTAGHIVWHCGHATAQRRFLSYPRSVERTGPRQYLVADTAHDRIVELEGGQAIERCVSAQPPLFWPRCVRALPSGGLLIADGRNGRIVEVAVDGLVCRELSEIRLDGRKPLRDPHDVRMLANGHLLITDSPRNLVVEVDWSGHVYRVIGDQDEKAMQLRDPHSAQLLDDGRVVIVDTGNHRILIVGHDGQLVREVTIIAMNGGYLRLNCPRYAEVIEDGTMVIADTGNNRVLAVTSAARLVWEFSQIAGAQPSHLNQPRWAHLISRQEVVVCDHFHHRILHVRQTSRAE